jgi:hypothetical protein
MINHMNLDKRLRAFIRACPFGYHFTAGNPVPLPFPPERKFLDAIDGFPRIAAEELRDVRASLQYKDFYVLTTFAARMAILAVRTRDRALLRRAVIAFLIDDHLVDYRDALGRVAVLNDCAARLGADLEHLLRPHRDFCYDCRWRLMQGFFQRLPEQKEVQVFGFHACEGEDGLEYA